MNLFLRNSDKIYYVESTKEIEPELHKKLPRKDVYLVEMSIAANSKYFITTDVTLFENLNETFEELGIKAFMAEDFIKLYPNIIP